MLSKHIEEHGTVLVVDDNPLVLSVVKNILNSDGSNVIAAANGAEALAVLERSNVDVIVCDVMMPTMDGLTFHNAVRKKADLSHIPFVFLSALDDPDEIRKGCETGCDGYLVKPFEPKDLLSVVKGKIVRSKGLKSLSEDQYESYRRRVVHVLSHEFRTPLVAINTGAEILLDAGQSMDLNRIRSLIEAIHRGGQRLERLVTDFMLLQQIEAGISQQLFNNRSDVVYAASLLEHFARSVDEDLKDSGFVSTVSILSPTARVRVYEPQIQEVLNRLVSNAKKFKSDRSEIDFVLSQRESKVIFEVRDRGIGMNIKQVREAISLFGQLDRDKLEQQGGGIGLALAARYLAIHGGTLEFELRAGGGTIVSFALPLIE